MFEEYRQKEEGASAYLELRCVLNAISFYLKKKKPDIDRDCDWTNYPQAYIRDLLETLLYFITKK